MVVCGQVNKVLDLASEGLGFDSQYWPHVEVLGKLHISHYLSPLSRNGYLVYKSNVGSIVAGCIASHLTRGKVQSVEHALPWSLDSNNYLHLLPLSYYINICTRVFTFTGIGASVSNFHVEKRKYCTLKHMFKYIVCIHSIMIQFLIYQMPATAWLMW